MSHLHALLVFSVLGLALTPTVLEALPVLRGAGSHVIAEMPGFREFEHAIRWSLVVICGAGAWLVMRAFHWTPPLNHPRRSSLVFAALWWLCQPVCLYLYSHASGNSTFITRYLSLALPGTAMMATTVAAYSIPDRLWRPLAVVMGVGVLIVMGQWTTRSPRHDNSNWRAAAVEENKLAGAATPVIVPSPFVEAKSPVWTPDYHLPGFLYAQLEYYPIKGRLYLFPFGGSPEDGVSYASTLTKQTLSGSRRFVIYGGDKFWLNWFRTRSELAGWNSRMERFGDIEVDVFEHPGY